MKILAVESSAVSVSVCLEEEGRLIAQDFQNCGLTHSRTLLPMVEHVLSGCGLTANDVDGFAVAGGPGSFTGIRIGVATVKGLALGTNKPCAAVSTLEAMAWGLLGLTGEVSCVMDARAEQVYHARFMLTPEGPVRLCQDRAIKIDTLAKEIAKKPQFLVGDGADLCYTKLKEDCSGLCLAPPHLIYPTAWGVACAARDILASGQGVSAAALREQYLRAPQAERERARKLAEAKKF